MDASGGRGSCPLARLLSAVPPDGVPLAHPRRLTPIATTVSDSHRPLHAPRQVSFRTTGDVALLDHAERVAYNALPATIDADMWSHQYLQQVNGVRAAFTEPHVWLADGPNATVFGLEPNYGCCTANFNQGWPKLASHVLLQSAQDGGVVVGVRPCKEPPPGGE